MQVAQQVLVSLISHSIQQAEPGDFHLTAAAEQERATITLSFPPMPQAAQESIVNPVTAQLVERLGWDIEMQDGPAGECVVLIYMTAYGPTVLVIDDNEGLVDLLHLLVIHSDIWTLD